MKKDSDNQLFFDFDTPGCSSLPVMEAAANKDAAIVDASELPPEVELEAESADIAEAAVAVSTAVEQQMIAEEQNEVQKAEKNKNFPVFNVYGIQGLCYVIILLRFLKFS